MNWKTILALLLGIGIVYVCYFRCRPTNCDSEVLYDGQYFKGMIFLLHTNRTSNTGIVAQIDSNYKKIAGLIYDGTGFSCTTAQIEDTVFFKIRKYKNNGPIMAFDLTYLQPNAFSTTIIDTTYFGNFNLTRRFNDHLASSDACRTVGTAHSKYHYEGKVLPTNTQIFMGRKHFLQKWTDDLHADFTFYSSDTMLIHDSVWYLDLRTEAGGSKRILSMSVNDNH